MMRRWLWIGLAVIVFLGGWSVWLWQSYFVVEPGQQAVVERGASVEVLDAGLHLVSPFGGDVTIYDVLFERQHRVAEPVMVDGCAVSLILTYNVADVVAFHEAGGDIRALAGRDAQVLALAEAADLSWEGLRGPEMQALRAAIGGVLPPGLGLLRLHADVAECERAALEGEPPAPVEVERVLVDLVPAEAPLGAERVEIEPVQLVSANGMRLELSGAVATFDISDPLRARACFGDFEDMPGVQVERVVAAGMREAAGGHARADVPEAFAGLAPRGAERMETDCGLRIGPVDFGDARLEWIRAAR